jgi:hypothetical protein
MSSSKPYLAGKMEYLEMIRRKDFWDSDVNPHDELEYSEFQKPYALDDDEDDAYPSWEWIFPRIDPWPDPFPLPDIDPHPCSFDDDCVWAGIIGPGEMECEDCYTYSQAHVYYGCDVAPWWAAYGSWTIDSNVTDGRCYLLFSGPVMATVCCEEDSVGSFTLTYSGPLDCNGSISVDVTCGRCCEDMTLTGADTVAQSGTWTGTISPACPGVECSVTSNSGCSLSCVLNEAGSEVTVTVGSSDCGGFLVTVTDASVAGGECAANTDSKHVRITGGTGDWRFDTTGTAISCGEVTACNEDGNCGCGYGSAYPHSACVVDNQYKYGLNNGGDFDCSQNYGRSCLAGSSCTCTGSWPPCPAGGTDCGHPGGACGGGPDYCTARHWHRCKWTCSDDENCS